MQHDKNAFGISKWSHPARPLKVVARNQNMEIRMEKNKLTKQMNGWHGDGRMER
jgi:hypothetical protein